MTTPRKDRYEGMRGKWDRNGNWLCDCAGRNGDALYRCARCGVRRPLKGSPVYDLRKINDGGFMPSSVLRVVKQTDGAA